MKISSILDQIDLGNYAIPVFQRGYVWNRDQVRKLMSSLYKGHPVGSLLVWDTKLTDSELIRGELNRENNNVRLILDGQQRMTSLYGIFRGKTPPFFEGNSRAFFDLYFNAETKTFEFYAPMKMNNNPLWINVNEFLLKGIGSYIGERKYLMDYFDNLTHLDIIRNFDIPIQEVTGEDKTIDVVVEIFNNVNSGGTTLSKGDLAMAKLTAEWPDARKELNKILSKYKKRGFNFTMDWLLRNITVFLTSQPYYSALSDVDILKFKESLPVVDKHIGTILDQIGSRLGLDHDRVIKSKYSFPIIIQMIKNEGGRITDYKLWNKIMFWYIHTFLWGRYSASTESTLAQDLNILKDGQGIDGLIDILRKNRGSLEIKPEDFVTWSVGSRFYPLLYLLTRVNGSQDWITGVELKKGLLGSNSTLEMHHIFPRNLLYNEGYERMEVNTLANYTFLTKETNILISNRRPEDYMFEVDERNPDYLKSHWIPEDKNLWNMERYEDFIVSRRKLLASAANDFLASLYSSEDKEDVTVEVNTLAVMVNTPDEEMIDELSKWMTDNGLTSGEANYELIDAQNEPLAIFDLAWPNGIQEGLSKPVAVLINEPDYIHEAANKNGFTYYTDINDFKTYIKENYLELD